ncbi:MAG: hypothetical protein HYR68_12835 [Burkholderiales bacterium]|nr:hypothetical protein [Burkholderiales bacterium]MBI3730962.1 hypothetical protein [Burkholderiales bacterium]
MKSFRIFAIALGLVMLAGSAGARPGGHHFHPRVSIGVSIPPLYFNYGSRHSYVSAYYPYDYSWRYYPSLVIAPTVSYVTPVVSTGNVVYTDSYDTYNTYTPNYSNDSNIISQPNSTPQSTAGKDWLYCHQPDGFYPAIKSCPSGWERVPAQAR